MNKSNAPQAPIKGLIKWAVIGLLVIATLVTGFKSAYTVPEGNVYVVKKFGEAVRAETPGLNFKIPYVEDGLEIDVRTRKNTETMSVATKEQMQAQAIVSVNWTVKSAAVLELYKKYGSLDQFENKILDPKLKEATKEGIAKFTAEENINIREQVRLAMAEALRAKMASYPVVINDINYENIALPKKYLESIDAKQTAKNMEDAEEFKLGQQNLVAQQRVNTANADRDATKSRADGAAYKINVEAEAEANAIELRGKAEASAIKAKAKVLKNNPLIVELTRVQTWDGAVSKWSTGGAGSNMLVNVGKPE